jgi:virginiamycin B lyase
LVRGIRRSRALLALGIVIFLSASLLYLSLQLPAVPSCGEKIGQARVSKFSLPSVHFTGVTKFRLPGDEFPNSIVAISDGSVWFGEQNVPGVAHLYPNGTMLEYAWPVSYSPSTTSIWGIAQWNSRIWASDALGSQIVGLDTYTGTLYAVKLSDVQAFPYTITIGPDGALWFTELFVSKLGRIDAQCRLREYSVPSNFGGTPTQIRFENSTSGYYVDAGSANSGLGTLLSFDPNQFSPQPFGGTSTLRAPSSLVSVPGGVWVAQHASSSVAFYDLNTRQWVFFPTTPISYEDTTLPYFVAANGSKVWFNEHYANRMAKLDPANGLLTEYSLSDPPASRIVRIDNAITFALGKDKVWFTELTANYVGFVDAAYKPNFTISTPSNSILKLKPGVSVSIRFNVSGQSSNPLTVQFADTENVTGRLQRILMKTNMTEIPSLNARKEILVTITADKALSPGSYTLLVTVTDGLVNQGAYLKLQVTT